MIFFFLRSSRFSFWIRSQNYYCFYFIWYISVIVVSKRETVPLYVWMCISTVKYNDRYEYESSFIFAIPTNTYEMLSTWNLLHVYIFFSIFNKYEAQLSITWYNIELEVDAYVNNTTIYSIINLSPFYVKRGFKMKIHIIKVANHVFISVNIYTNI